MSIFEKPIEQINFTDIESLVTHKIMEDVRLEFKEAAWDRKDESTKEMLKDVTSIANSHGGFIIVGIKENTENGAAEEIKNIENAEDERDRIINICLSSIQPHIGNLRIVVLNDSGKNIVLIKVPYSFRSPHMITHGGINQFWTRHDRRKSKMSVEEIEDAFIKKFNLTKSAEEFLAERRNNFEKIIAEPHLIMGAFPIEQRGEFLDTKDQTIREIIKRQPDVRYDGWDFDFENGEVKPSYNGLTVGHPQDWRVVDLFRNGYFEARVSNAGEAGFILGPKKTEYVESGQVKTKERILLSTWRVSEYIHSFFVQLNRISKYFGYDGQYLIFVDLLNISGCGLTKGHLSNSGSITLWDLGFWNEKNLKLGTFSIDTTDADTTADFILDRMWQSFGHEENPFTIEDGKIKELWKNN